MIQEVEHKLNNYGTIFAFSGFISYNILSTLSQAVKEELYKDEKLKKELFNVYFVFVELLQNIMNYSTKREPYNNAGGGTCIISRTPDNIGYIVSSGNMIDSQKVEALQEKIEKINSLNQDELKQYHREVRKEGKYAHEKGAGLGIIEIARKASKGLDYKITKVDEENSYFEIYVNI